jgi:hypothetical protein
LYPQPQIPAPLSPPPPPNPSRPKAFNSLDPLHMDLAKGYRYDFKMEFNLISFLKIFGES